METNTRETTDFVIVIPPAGIKNAIYPPYGAMYVAAALKKIGFSTKILNVDTERITNKEAIERIRGIDPKYIGFSGIVAPSYRYIKELSIQLKREFPDKIQILGGGLASAVKPLFENTPIDIVVLGEADLTVADLFKCLESKGDLNNIAGICFRNGTSYTQTAKGRLVTNLDSLPYPEFGLIDMDRYLPDGKEFIHRFTTKLKDKRIYDPNRKKKMLTIPTSRGCFAQCSFCFRAYPGIRVNSIKYVFDFIEYCLNKFDVGFLTLGDECFAPSKARNWEFVEEYKRRKSNFVFRVLGMRVDTVDKEILRAFKEIGCWMIEYGFESGSQKMLNIMDKRVSVEQNRQVALWTEEAGIYTSPTLVLGMPGETQETIRESIDFIKFLNFGFKQYQWTYALPIPGAPLYDFIKLTGAIKDEDEYLVSLDGPVAGAGVFHVNMTDEPDEIVAGWADRVRDEVDADYFKKRYKFGFIAKIMDIFEKIKLHNKRKDLLLVIKAKIKSTFSSYMKSKTATEETKITVKFRKDKNVVVEDLLKGMDFRTPNREMSLKKINYKIAQANQSSPLTT